jgi:hypothetical protein
MKQELIIFTKAYDFTLWMMNHTAKFPKSSRFSVSVRVENKLLDILEGILSANREWDKGRYLSKTDEDLEKLRIFIRLSKDMRFLNVQSYEYAVRQMEEIGRLLGGWIKQQKAITANRAD